MRQLCLCGGLFLAGLAVGFWCFGPSEQPPPLLPLRATRVAPTTRRHRVSGRTVAVRAPFTPVLGAHDVLRQDSEKRRARLAEVALKKYTLCLADSHLTDDDAPRLMAVLDDIGTELKR